MTPQPPDPCEPPYSDVSSFEQDIYAELRVLSFSGRIGRLRYMAYSLALVLILSLCGMLIGVTVGPFQASATGGMGTLIATMIFYVVVMVASITLAVRRLNDLNRSGWLVLLFFIPAVNVIFGFVLWLVPGTKGANNYGLQPPPNSVGVIILGLMFPVLMIIGIALVITLPAFNDYQHLDEQMQNF